jgi:hypothetical protein
MAVYQYQPLKSHEIRLLKLTSSNPPRYTLRHVDFSPEKKPKYVALSYTWGNVEPSLPLELDSGQVLITPNLEHALKCLAKDHPSRYLWTDAICINQKPVNAEQKAEKNAQIRLMTAIYERAFPVYVWLGNPSDLNTESNSLAQAHLQYLEERYLAEFVRVSRSQFRPWWWPRTAPTEADVFAPMSALVQQIAKNDRHVFDNPGTTTYKAWQGIAELFTASWWTRTWVYQEATVPEMAQIKAYGLGLLGVPIILRTTTEPARVTFRFGECSTTWRQMEIASVLAKRLMSTHMSARIADLIEDNVATSQRLRLVRALRLAKRPIEMLDLLMWFRFSECRDPRDKVYAPLCLAPEEAMRAVDPDYVGKGFRRVCEDVVDYYMNKRSLDFLGHCQARQPEDEPWPSWLPDWRRDVVDTLPFSKILYIPPPEQRRVDPVSTHGSEAQMSEYTEARAYNAGGSAHVVARIEGHILEVRGLYIDTVGGSLEALPLTIQDAQAAADYLEDVHTFPGEDIITALGRTLVADVKVNGLSRPYQRHFALDWAFMARDRATLQPAAAHQQDIMRSALSSATVGRRICKTTRNRIGLVPDAAQAGDSIFALVGAQVLYVLRQEPQAGRGYELIGECYVHGMMDGEIWTTLARAGTDAGDIRIV